MLDEPNTVESSLKTLVESNQSISQKGVELELKSRGIENFDEVLKKVESELGNKLKQQNREEINSLRKDFFVTFGLFASFITFIVGEISILTSVEDIFDKLGFGFLLVSLMLGFLFGILFVVNDEKYVDKYKKMGWVFALFFFLGLAFIIVPKLFL